MLYEYFKNSKSKLIPRYSSVSYSNQFLYLKYGINLENLVKLIVK